MIGNIRSFNEPEVKRVIQALISEIERLKHEVEIQKRLIDALRRAGEE